MSLKVLSVLVTCLMLLLAGARPHFEFAKNNGDAFRQRSEEPRLSSPNQNHADLSLRVLPDPVSDMVHREIGTQLLIDSVPASDFTLITFVKHVRGQLLPWITRGAVTNGTNPVSAKNAHMDAVKALSEDQLRAMDAILVSSPKVASQRHGLHAEPSPLPISPPLSRLFGLVTYNATASQRIGNLDLLDAVVAVECGFDVLRLSVNISALSGVPIGVENTATSLLQILGLYQNEPVYGGVEWGCLGGESATTQVPAVITRVLVSATLDLITTESNPAVFVLVLQTHDHSFLDLFDEAAVEYVAATSVRQLLLLEPMRILLSQPESVVTPADIAVNVVPAVVIVPEAHLTMLAQVDEASVAVPPNLMISGCSWSWWATTYNLCSDFNFEGGTIRLDWNCEYNLYRLQVYLSVGMALDPLIEDTSVSGLTGSRSYTIQDYWSFTSDANGLYFRLTVDDCYGWKICLFDSSYDTANFAVPRLFNLKTPTFVSDPITTYSIGDTVDFEWTCSNMPYGADGYVTVKLKEDSIMGYTVPIGTYASSNGKGSGSVTLQSNWVRSHALYLEFSIQSYKSGGQTSYNSAKFSLSPLFFTQPSGINPSSPGSTMTIAWTSQSSSSINAAVQLYQDVPLSSDPKWDLLSSLTIYPNQDGSTSITIPSSVPPHILPYYISFKHDCWDLLVYNWCSFTSSPRFMIPETTSPAFWNLYSISDTQAKAPISIHHSDCNTLQCPQTTSAACRADDTCSSTCQVCLDESPNTPYVNDVSCVNCWAKYSTHVTRFLLLKEYFSVRRFILTGTASATVNMDLSMNLNMNTSKTNSFNIIDNVGIPGLSTSFSILGLSFQFGAFVSIAGNYYLQGSAVGNAAGGFDATGNVDGLIQYGTDFASSSTGMLPENVHSGWIKNKHPWTASMNAFLTVRTGLVVTLQLKLAAGASTSPPLAQVQLIVAPYIITQLRFAYPPMVALTQLNSNADSAFYTFPTTGCNFPHVLEYGITVGLDCSAGASLSLSSLSIPLLSYDRQWSVPLVGVRQVLLGGCFGTVSDSSAAALDATRIVLPLNAAALPLANKVDTIVKRDRLWKSVNTRLTSAISSALSVTPQRLKISLDLAALAVRDNSGGSTLNILIDILPASDTTVDTNQISSIKSNLLAQIASPSSSLNTKPIIKAAYIIAPITSPPTLAPLPTGSPITAGPTVTPVPQVSPALQVVVRLSTDTSVISDPVRLSRFKLDFVSDVAKSLKMRAERVLVQSVMAGSLVVQFVLLPGIETEATPAILAADFQTQFYLPTSPLRSGVVTSNVDTTIAPSISTVPICSDGSYQTVCPIQASANTPGFGVFTIILAVGGVLVVAAIAGAVWFLYYRGPQQKLFTASEFVAEPAAMASKQIELVVVSNTNPVVVAQTQI